MDGNTGAVTGVKEGSCRVTLTLSKTGFNDKVIEYVVPVSFSLGDFKGKHLFKSLFLGSRTKPVFADIDKDGDLDLVVGADDGTLKYYRKNAIDAPTLFTELVGADNPFNSVNVGRLSAPAFADIDGDSDLDLVVGEYDGVLNYFRNESANGTITFTEKTGTGNPFNGINVIVNSFPSFADINGDDKIDLVVGRGNGTLNYYLNESANGSITFTAKTSASENPFNGIDVGLSSNPTFVHINGDDKIDLVIGENDGILNYYLNESTEETITFTAKTSVSENPFNGIDVGDFSSSAFADIDGDNKIDLVVGEHTGTLRYFLNESNTSIVFTDKTESNNPLNTVNAGANTYLDPTFAYINNDNKIDMIVGQVDGTLNFYLNESTTNLTI